MVTKAPNQDSQDSKLSAAVASKVFAWKNVRRSEGRLLGKRQDRSGRWRTAKVPDYANDTRAAYAIDERMKQLGYATRYQKELARITKAKNLPPDWATPEQRSRAALKVIGK